MDYTIEVNERVEVIARYRTLGNGRDLLAICFPAKMQFRGQVIAFTELGLRHPTTKGKRMIHVFDMSDGSNDYRLEFDAEGLTWTLVAILPGLQPADEPQEQPARLAAHRRQPQRRGSGNGEVG